MRLILLSISLIFLQACSLPEQLTKQETKQTTIKEVKPRAVTNPSLQTCRKLWPEMLKQLKAANETTVLTAKLIGGSTQLRKGKMHCILEVVLLDHKAKKVDGKIPARAYHFAINSVTFNVDSWSVAK